VKSPWSATGVEIHKVVECSFENIVFVTRRTKTRDIVHVDATNGHKQPLEMSVELTM
jgi:hypothetical protein